MGDLYLARHGETEWSRSGRHTGGTDLPLTPAGEAQARSLAPLLAGRAFALVLTSPWPVPAAPPSWRAWPAPNRNRTCASGTTGRTRA